MQEVRQPMKLIVINDNGYWCVKRLLYNAKTKAVRWVRVSDYYPYESIAINLMNYLNATL